MKIGIISDTHNKVKKTKDALELLLKNGVEFIIHAGDIVELEILDMLESTSVGYLAVYGNNDAHLVQYHEKYQLVQEPYYFSLANLKFKLMHLPFYMAPDADVIIYGHTHYFNCEYKGKALFLNSGEVCARKKPASECVILETFDDKFIVTQYTKPEDKVKFQTKIHTIKRENNV
jgi:putative phosphoesterase